MSRLACRAGLPRRVVLLLHCRKYNFQSFSITPCRLFSIAASCILILPHFHIAAFSYCRIFTLLHFHIDILPLLLFHIFKNIIYAHYIFLGHHFCSLALPPLCHIPAFLHPIFLLTFSPGLLGLGLHGLLPFRVMIPVKFPHELPMGTSWIQGMFFYHHIPSCLQSYSFQPAGLLSDWFIIRAIIRK